MKAGFNPSYISGNHLPLGDEKTYIVKVVHNSMMQHRHLVDDYIFTLRLMDLLMMRKSSGLKMKYPGEKGLAGEARGLRQLSI